MKVKSFGEFIGESRQSKVEAFCLKHNLTASEFFGDQEIDGNLSIADVKIPNGFNPKVTGDLFLHKLKKIPDGFSPQVGGQLWIQQVTWIGDDFNPQLGGIFSFNVIRIPENFRIRVKSLALPMVVKIPDGFSPIVNGSLDLDSVEEIGRGFSPQVGGSLHLPKLTKIPKDFNPQIDRELFLDLDKLSPADLKRIYFNQDLPKMVREEAAAHPNFGDIIGDEDGILGDW